MSEKVSFNPKDYDPKNEFDPKNHKFGSFGLTDTDRRKLELYPGIVLVLKDCYHELCKREGFRLSPLELKIRNIANKAAELDKKP